MKFRQYNRILIFPVVAGQFSVPSVLGCRCSEPRGNLGTDCSDLTN